MIYLYTSCIFYKTLKIHCTIKFILLFYFIVKIQVCHVIPICSVTGTKPIIAWTRWYRIYIQFWAKNGLSYVYPGSLSQSFASIADFCRLFRFKSLSSRSPDSYIATQALWLRHASGRLNVRNVVKEVTNGSKAKHLKTGMNFRSPQL